MHPYQGLPDHQFWKRAVSNVEPFRVDPVTHAKFQITPLQRVSTAGSCFAQHISKHLKSWGFSYFVPEAAGHLPASEQQALQYGVFSARYGNLYTVRQLRQLFEEAFGRRTPSVSSWAREDGSFADPLRPNIQPHGFPSLDALLADRQAHLAHVRTVFLDSDVFVFTLGLTEAWRHRSSGDVYPLAPGVAAGHYDPELYEFVNFSAHETQLDLLSFLSDLKACNPRVQVLLTVSPVPLIATYEPRHVLVSTILSKSILRVAAQTALDTFPWVDYFPSYELFAGSHHQGRYFQQDLREAAPLGVAHAMRLFAAHYLKRDADSSRPLPDATRATTHGPQMQEILCDEESIAQISF
jgi:hypothetical protein